MDQHSLERTSSLGKLTEKPCEECSIPMKTISETQLGGMFSDENFECIHRNPNFPTSEGRNEQPTTEELCSIDESFTSDDCSTQSSDTQITSSEIIDSAAATVGETASSLRSEKSLTSQSNKFNSLPKSPNISPLHRRLQCSLSTESREHLRGVAVSPTFLSTSHNHSSQLKSILRSPGASITSLASISPTHTSTEQRVSVQTPPLATPSSASTDRTHSVLIEGTATVHNHTIVPTGNADVPKDKDSPSPSPSMDLEIVACKTMVSEEQCDGPNSIPQQLPSVRVQHSRSQSETSVDNLRRGLQFHVTFVEGEHPRKSTISTLVEEDLATESTNGATSPPSLLSASNRKPVTHQSSDGCVTSQQAGGNPHKVMFSECTQVQSLDSNDSDGDEKIKVVSCDIALLDMKTPELERKETIVDGHTTSIEANGVIESSSHELCKVSDKVKPHEPHSSKLKQKASPPTALSSATNPNYGSIVKRSKERVKHSSNKNDKTVNDIIPPAHKRSTGKGVRALSQLFESGSSSDSSSSVLPPSSTNSSPVHQPQRKVSVSKIPLPSELTAVTVVAPKPTKVTASGNSQKCSKVGTTPPKVPTKSTKGTPVSAAKRKVGTFEKVVSTSEQSSGPVKKVTAARKNSVYQQKVGVSSKSTSTSAALRSSRAEHTPVASVPRHTSNPSVGTRKQPSQKMPPSPSQKPKSSRNQTMNSGRGQQNPSSSDKRLKPHDSNPPRIGSQRRPSVASSRSPSPHSGGQTNHKPLSRLSGTRQPMRRKNGASGSNIASPITTRRNTQSLKPVAIEVDCNNSNSNNNNNGYNSCFTNDDKDGNTTGPSARVHPITDTTLLCPHRNESSPCLSPNSLHKMVRFNHKVIVNQCSQDSSDGDSCCSQGSSAAIDHDTSESLDQTHINSSWSQVDDQGMNSRMNKIQYHQSLHSSSLKHANKRSPLEWQHFGLSWRQTSLPGHHHPGHSHLVTSRTT